MNAYLNKTYCIPVQFLLLPDCGLLVAALFWFWGSICFCGDVGCGDGDDGDEGGGGFFPHSRLFTPSSFGSLFGGFKKVEVQN